MKNYGHPDQIGYGQPYDEYLIEMRRVFRVLYQLTKLEGSMWIISDTLRSDESRISDRPSPVEPLPFQLAQEAAEAGWVLREILVWQKHKTLPWSSGQRLRNVFEYVTLFVKSSKYKFYSDRLRDPENLEQWWVKWPERYNPNGKVPTNVWQIPVPQQGSWGNSVIQHACPLPPDLVERLLLLSTDEGDVVLDPFAGSGVVVAEANRLARKGIGVELNRKYVRAFEKAVVPAVRARSQHDPLRDRAAMAADLRQRIIKLRAMKYPKILWKQLHVKHGLPSPQLIIALMGKLEADTLSTPARPLPLKVVFVYRDTEADTLDTVVRVLKDVSSRAPATKFGIAGDVHACNAEDLSMHLSPRQRLYLYERGRTWESLGRVRQADLLGLQATTPRRGQHAYPPIVSNVQVNEEPDGKT